MLLLRFGLGLRTVPQGPLFDRFAGGFPGGFLIGIFFLESAEVILFCFAFCGVFCLDLQMGLFPGQPAMVLSSSRPCIKAAPCASMLCSKNC